MIAALPIKHDTVRIDLLRISDDFSRKLRWLMNFDNVLSFERLRQGGDSLFVALVNKDLRSF